MRGYQLVSGSSGVYRAEEARLSQGVLDTGHRGYTGAGFVNLSDAAGSHAEWTLHSAAAASATLTVRYANGTAAGRPMDVTVNGARAAAVSFPPTADWDTWAATSLPVALRAGTNTVRLTATGAAGGPNLDRIELR
ncbi:carbohydrate-binding protein [Kitasatospora sp. NPDC048540]|uniref:carbohydrate-binding protein n=1 Tax=unclassified Kitasatospora TaxID=2633591 RepID=UPI001E31F17C|nr:carbohydrate-binding protein [Kitasatospora sp. MBT63]